tara:strand:+ start:1785 stop:2081 length:297 start_codon:yes stop_codon:yes gene_type:complete
MSRYNNIQIRKIQSGKRYFKTVRYPVIEKSLDDRYIVGQFGDRLDNLANQYYEDASLWWIIARANNIGKGDLVVPLGVQLRIPFEYIAIVDMFNKLNK